MTVQPLTAKAFMEIELAPIETIVAAAIRLQNFSIFCHPPEFPDYFIISAPPPVRHHQLVQPINDMTMRRVPADDQGFLTSSGRFVGRIEAKEIALASGQFLIMPLSSERPELYSEDLW